MPDVNRVWDVGVLSGEVINVVKENMDRKKLYAIMPGSSQHSGNISPVLGCHCCFFTSCFIIM